MLSPGFRDEPAGALLLTSLSMRFEPGAHTAILPPAGHMCKRNVSRPFRPAEWSRDGTGEHGAHVLVKPKEVGNLRLSS